ncbi:MAG: HNH endonuclease [Planctomycetota bacterium]
MKTLRPGEPVFFKLKSPLHCIAGYGFFAHFSLLDLGLAWETFGARNGFMDRQQFFRGLSGYRGTNRMQEDPASRPLACTMLREAVFWPKSRWIPWGREQGWAMNNTRGATERDPSRADRLLREIEFDHHVEPEEFAPSFQLVDVDSRAIESAQIYRREGQGAFRARLLTAYKNRCAVSGEKTVPVLDAAHVQPYLGPRSNHIQNGLLLTKELHALFDHRLLTITPEYRVRVSSKIREKWSNGRRYYEFNDRELVSIPTADDQRPSRDALRWHNEYWFQP